MKREGPIKHCWCCNRSMMKQAMKCAMCGSDQGPRRKEADASEALRIKALVLGTAAAMFIAGAIP